MTDSELLAIFDSEVRRECEWTRMQRETFPNLVRYTSQEPGRDSGFISWTNLTDDTADAEIEHQVEHYRTLKAELEWIVYTHDLPEDLGDRLQAHGFEPANDPGAVMVIDLHDLPKEMLSMDISSANRITTAAEVDAIFAMENEVWGKDLTRVGERLKHDLVESPDRLSIFAVRDGERVVSAAWAFYLVPTSFVGLFGGSTLKEYRKRGYYTALLAARAREALERGYRFLHVDAGPESQPILAKHGFSCLGYSNSFNWKPEAEGKTLKT